MAYNRSKTQSSQTDILLSLLRFIGGNTLYSGLMGSIILSALLSLVLPGAGARRMAENTAFALTGATVAAGIAGSKSGEIRSHAEKAKALSDELAKKLSAQELAAQQQSIAMQARTAALNTQEATYRQRCENASEKRLQRELEAGKRKAQAEANKAVRDAQSRLKASEKKLEGAIAQHKKILADAEKHYQGKIDSAAIESQVAVDRLNGEIAQAKTEAVTARQELSRAGRELEALKAQQGDVQELLNRKAAQVGQTVFMQQQGVLSEAEADSKKAIQKTALELQWEKQERLRLSAENSRIKGPKLFRASTVEANIGNKIISTLANSDPKVFLSGEDIGDLKYGEVTYKLEAFGCSLKEVEAALEKESLQLGFSPEPTVKNGGDGFLYLTARISGETRPKGSLIKRVSDRKLQQAFLDIKFGLRFTGYTGRGKSTLLNNVIELYENELNTRFTIFDPKVDFPSADYPNNTVYRGLEKCVNQIDIIGETCKARQDYKVLNDEQGVSIPAQHLQPKLYLIDECKDIHDAAALADMDEKPADRKYVKNFRFSIQKGLEVGRGLGLRVVYSTVTPDSSDFGFKNSVFKQSATVFLGDQCYEALGTKSQYLTTVSDVKKAQLRQEYDARVASSDERDNFIGLFFNGLTNEIFFFSPPTPGAWVSAATARKTTFSKPANKGGCAAPAQVAENRSTRSPIDTGGLRAICADENLGKDLGKDCAQSAQLAQPALTLPEIRKVGTPCPDCEAISKSPVRSRIRKSDSTVEMKCKTKDCVSGGTFRAKVSS